MNDYFVVEETPQPPASMFQLSESQASLGDSLELGSELAPASMSAAIPASMGASGSDQQPASGPAINSGTGLPPDAGHYLEADGPQSSALARMTLEQRVVRMTDRLWAKLAIMEEHAAAMHSDMVRLKAEARLSVGPAVAAEPDGELVKGQIYDLSARLDDLQASQDGLQNEFAGQQAVVRQLLAAQEDMTGENVTKEELQVLCGNLDAKISQSLQESIDEQNVGLQSHVKGLEDLMRGVEDRLREQVSAVQLKVSAVEAQANAKIENIGEQTSQVQEQTKQVTLDLEASNRGHLGESTETKQELQRLKEALSQAWGQMRDQAADFEEKCNNSLNTAMEAVAKESETRSKAFQDSQQDLSRLHDVQEDVLKPGLARFEILVPSLVAELQDHGPQLKEAMSAISTINEMRVDLNDCILNAQQSKDSLESLKEQQTELHDASEGTLKQLEDAERTIEFVKDDLQKHRLATTPCIKEVESLLQKVDTLQDQLSQAQAQSQHTRGDLDDLKQKEVRRGEDLASVQQSIPPLESKTQMLESLLGDVRTSLIDADSRVQRLKSELSEGLAEERSSTRKDCDNAAERCQSEARPRLESLEIWRGSVDQQQATIRERCDTQEHRNLLQAAASDEKLHRLAEQWQVGVRSLEARLDEARAAAKEDLTATTLSLHMGEMALITKMAQLSSHVHRA
jgi:chromosome segregation ATPase